MADLTDTTQALITRIKALREIAEKRQRGIWDAADEVKYTPAAMIELYDAVLKVLEGR